MTFSKPITEIIQERYSCRRYLAQSIKEEKQRKLADFMAAHRSGPLGTSSRFELVAATEQDRKALKGLGTYGFIKGATGFIIGAMGDGEKNLEDFGYLMEHIILYATDMGLGTCWLGGSFTKSRFAKKIGVSSSESVPAVTSVGYISKKPRRVNSVARPSAGSDRRYPWERLFFNGAFGNPFSLDLAGEYAVPLEMVRLGPSASNEQPWRIVRKNGAWHFYMQRTKGYRNKMLARLIKIDDLQRIDMGIAMSHFELAACELGLKGRWELVEPDIVVPDEMTEYTASWLN